MAVTRRYTVVDKTCWRFLEIDGIRIEFCHPRKCPLFFNDDELMRCFHPNHGFHCIIHREQFSCPARHIPGVEVCRKCDGEGDYADAKQLSRVKCQTCGGTGKIEVVQ